VGALSAATRRLFFALWPDDAIRQALFHWQVHNLTSAVRWTHRTDLHMTLHFLGQVDVARIDGLLELGAGVERSPIALVLDEIGYWPRPQVLWAGPSSMSGELGALHARLGDGLRARGFSTEVRDYRPHITLARKVRERPDLRPLEPLSWLVSELALVESRAGTAPMYRPIARWPLG